MGTWNVTWDDGDGSSYSIKLKGSSVHMNLVTCSASATTCASPQEVVVVWSESGTYPKSDGWVQVEDIHGGRVIVYMKRDGGGLSLVWYRPNTGGTATGKGRKFTRKYLVYT